MCSGRGYSLDVGFFFLMIRHPPRSPLFPYPTPFRSTPAFEDSVAIVFDRPDERQIVFERMDWSHANRRGYYEKNKAFIAEAASPLADALTEDPIQEIGRAHV